MTPTEFDAAIARRRRITGETHAAASKALLAIIRERRMASEAQIAELERKVKGR